MRTRLFIENTEVEIDESVQFAITKQFEDLSNPTTIINSWSKTVSIPFTEKNNILFGHIYNADRLIAEGGTSITGIYFNPYKKLDFRLQWGDSVLMVGYAKMNEVKQNDGKGTYEITLFGELGKIFHELKKITFDKSTTDTEYLIDGSQYVDEYIDKDLVYKSWTSSGQTQSTLQKKYFHGIDNNNIIISPNLAYKVTDIIGFAPNNAYSKGFDYKTVQSSSRSSMSIADLVGADAFKDATGVEFNTAVPNGLTPRGIGEYRSYNQLPFVYWNKLFQMFTRKAKTVTGYDIELDDDWFNTNNPYWYNLVYMLKKFNTEENTSVATNYYQPYGGSNIYWTKDGYDKAEQSDWIGVYETTEAYPLVNEFRVTPAIFRTSNDYDLKFDFAFGETFKVAAHATATGDVVFDNNNGLQITYEFLNDSTVIDTRTILLCGDNYTVSGVGYDSVYRFGTGVYNNGYFEFQLNDNFHLNVSKRLYTTDMRIRIKAVWLNSNLPFTLNGQPYGGYGTSLNTFTFNPVNSSISVQQDKRIKTNTRFTFNDLWDNRHNLFEEILKYCKMFRIFIYTDNYNKKLYFKPYWKYFQNYTVTDWGNKVDKSKDYIIEPITFSNKYILFNYKDSEVELSKIYKENYGVNYGEYRLTTDYNFNSDTNELFKGISQSIVNTDNILTISTLLRKKIIYSFCNDITVSNKDKDGGEVDVFGSFFYHKGLKTFENSSVLMLSMPNISDDSRLQQNNSTYFYTYIQTDRIACTTYPFLDILNGNQMCVFNVPKANFTQANNYANKTDIYSAFWKNYLDERYNIQNKKITCYIKLSPIDFINFQWNQFVVIGNQLCMVNKIYDYDITSNQPTKVDLITIQDVTGYTT